MKRSMMKIPAYMCSVKMIVRRAILSSVGIMFLIFSASAQESPSFPELSSLTFSFVQTKSSDMLASDAVSRGKMAFVAPDRLRWEYLSPCRSLFIINGERMLVDNADGRRITDLKSSGAFAGMFSMMMPLLRGDFRAVESRGFSAELSDGGGEHLLLRIVPVKPAAKRMFSEVVAEIDRTTGVAAKVTVLEKNGDRTVISCRGIVPDAPVDGGLFEF